MATAASAAQVAAAFAAYQEITSAIAVLDAGGSPYGLIVQDQNGAQFTVRVPGMPAANVRTFLVNHQTTLANAITAAGYTLT